MTVSRVCEQCGGPFEADAYEVLNGRGRFCSWHCHNESRVEPIEARFWRLTQKGDGCWLWLGLRNKFGYGRLSHSRKGGKIVGAHRFSWELHHGPIPDGLCVLHHCDNPPCVNPAHLWLGTLKENSDDCIRKGRRARGWHVALEHRNIGEKNAQAQLTEDKVREIRARYAAGETNLRLLGAAVGAEKANVWAIVHRKSWRHIP